MAIKEIWKTVPNYEGEYEVSSKGRVRSVKAKRPDKGHILKAYRNKRNGYLYLALSKNGVARTVRVHKIVMMAFNPRGEYGKYDKNLTINHIDGDKTNNSLGNLEWCTQSENQYEAIRLGLQKNEGLKIICLDDKSIYKSATEAARSVGGEIGEMVARVCRGERSHYRNKHFAFYDDYINNTIPTYKGRYKKKGSVCLWR